MGNMTADELSGHKYETIFCIFLVILAFLFRENAHLAYPQVLYLFLLLLFLNLTAGTVFRHWSFRPWMGWGVVLGNGAIITAILAYSGGADSNLWVLYLLPIYTSCMFLNGIGVVLILLGMIGCLFFFELSGGPDMNAGSAFYLSLKTVIFSFAAIATWRVAQKNRKARENLSAQRRKVAEMEEKVNRFILKAKESEKMADIGQVASGIAHDLNNPITVILGTVNMLLEDDSVRGPFRADLERILRSVELCKNITANVLSLARTNADLVAPCDLNEIVEAALAIYENLLVQNGIKISKRYAAGKATVLGSPSDLERVVLNLLSNARFAMKSGGVLKITTETVLSPDPAGVSRVQLTVEDTGAGIPPETMAHIFKPFNTTKSPGEGTGLGLYLCREIASYHHGALRAENVPGGGARFILSLPMAMAKSGGVKSQT